MKSFSIFNFLFLMAILISASACMEHCDCEDPVDVGTNRLTDYELKKLNIEINTNNLATGLETIFTNSENKQWEDSASRAQLVQLMIEEIRFFDDETGYFFVESYNAWMVAHATKPNLVGTYRYDIQDINGKYYVQDMVDLILYQGFGFVEYFFEHPTNSNDTKKLAYVDAIPTAEFFIGSGFYEFEFNTHDRYSARFDMVKNATKVISQALEAVLYTLDNTDDKIAFCRDFIDHMRFFDDRSGYFYIYDDKGVNIAHGSQENLQGQNLYDYQDSNGNYVIRGIINSLVDNEPGYYGYIWIMK